MSEYGRRVDVQVLLDRWEWPAGKIIETIDIKNDLLNFRFQKTIKTPEGSCQMAVLPQRADSHMLDIVKPMDVVRIIEFGTLKFIGYVQRISYDGAIGADGKPSRTATLTCKGMGALLVSASVGFGMSVGFGSPDDSFITAAAKMTKAIADAAIDGTSYAEMASVTINGFYDYLKTVGAKNLVTYLETYVDVSTGLSSKVTPAIPKSFELFTGTEQSITLWNLLDQLVERPFNELWSDNGPRTVSVDGKDVTLPEKSCLVFRPTPFNGTMASGSEGKAFDSLPIVKIDQDHLVSFNLARSMDEVYTFYSVKESAFNFSDIARIMTNQPKFDVDRLGKYLLRPMFAELFFTRVETKEGDKVDGTKGEFETAAKEAAITLYNWFKNNDVYLSGAISMMVPTDSSKDPKIGERIQVYGIEGDFYVEGIAHTWAYMGPLRSDLSVTRGINGEEPILLKDKMFKRSVIE